MDKDKILQKFENFTITAMEEAALMSYPTKKKVSKADGGKGFWVSSSRVGGCPRQVYHESIDPIQEQMTIGPKAGAILSGRALHTWAEEAITKEILPMGKATTEVLFWDRKNRLSGSIDLYFVSREGLRIVVDVKTKSRNGYKWALSHDLDRNHTMQIQAYMLHKDADIGYLLYLDRDALLQDGKVRATMLKIHRDDAAVIEWLDVVENAWKEGVVPEKPGQFHSGKPPCSWCLYWDRCYRSEQVEPTDVAPTPVAVVGQAKQTMEGIPTTPHSKIHTTEQTKGKKYGW
jgi:hypothetical protein